MLSEKFLYPMVNDKEIIPRFLDEYDHPWLRVLIDTYHRFENKRRGELDEYLLEPFPIYCPQRKKIQAIRVLNRLSRDQIRSPVPPKKVRDVVFTEAVSRGNRVAILSRAAKRLEMGEAQILESLFADLPTERRVGSLPNDLNAWRLATQVNLALTQGLMAKSQFVRIWLRGNSRDIIRYVKLKGLLCTVHSINSESEYSAHLEISGPFAIFKRTLVYGRALSSLVPRLSWCDKFLLKAICFYKDGLYVLNIRSGDPIFPSKEPSHFDSKIEERFYSDFGRKTSDWDIVREPKPVAVDGTLIFPDFEIIHKRNRSRKWLLEIIGFWTSEYLHKKLDRLRKAGLSNLILCIDQRRSLSQEDLPNASHCVFYQRRICSTDVLRIVESG